MVAGDARIYAESLEHHGEGYHLWNPQKLCLGDVGFFKDGQFHRLYNVLEGPSASADGSSEAREPRKSPIKGFADRAKSVARSMSPSPKHSQQISTQVPSKCSLKTTSQEPYTLEYRASSNVSQVRLNALVCVPGHPIGGSMWFHRTKGDSAVLVPRQYIQRKSLDQPFFLQSYLQDHSAWIIQNLGRGWGIEAKDLLIIYSQEVCSSWLLAVAKDHKDGGGVSVNASHYAGGEAIYEMGSASATVKSFPVNNHQPSASQGAHASVDSTAETMSGSVVSMQLDLDPAASVSHGKKPANHEHQSSDSLESSSAPLRPASFMSTSSAESYDIVARSDCRSFMSSSNPQLSPIKESIHPSPSGSKKTEHSAKSRALQPSSSSIDRDGTIGKTVGRGLSTAKYHRNQTQTQPHASTSRTRSEKRKSRETPSHENTEDEANQTLSIRCMTIYGEFQY